MIEKVNGEWVIPKSTVKSLEKSALLNGAEVTEENIKALRIYFRLNGPLVGSSVASSSKTKEE